MSSSAAASPAWMWCHECAMEIQPLRIPELACPRCRGSFIEELDADADADAGDEQDDEDARAWPFLGAQPPPQQRQQEEQQGAGIGAGAAHWLSALFGGAAAGGQQQPMQRTQASGSMGGPGGFQLSWNVQRGEGEMPMTLSELMAGGRRARAPSSSDDEEPFDDGMGGAGGAADGRLFNHDNPTRSAGPSAPMPGAFGAQGSSSGRREPVFLGGSGLAGLGRAQGWAPGPLPPAPGAPREDAEPGADLPPELAALRQMFTNILGPGAAGMLDMFGGALMGMGGRAGDYVWGQQGLDDVISDLMNQTSGSSAPPPADEEAIGKLEKRSRRQPDTLASARNRECPTCMDVFVPDASSSSRSASPAPASKGAEASSSSPADDPPEVVPRDEDMQQDELLLMPCQHLFHADCLVPWLKRSGTCPVCRLSIVGKTSPAASGDAAAATGATSSSAGASASASRGAHDGSGVTGEDTDEEQEEEETQEMRRERMRRAAETRAARHDEARMPGALGGDADELDLD